MGATRWAMADDGTFVRLEFVGIGGAAVPSLAALLERIEAQNDAWWNGSGERPDWWPPLGVSAVGAPAEASAREAAAVVEVVVDAPGAADRLESDLGLFAAEHLVGPVAVHAAVIEIGHRLVVLPGPSFTGKSSMCAAAVAAGHRVWSDEYALVDPATGEVTGWPRRIKLRGADGGTQRVDIGTAERASRRVDLIAFVAYDATLEVPLDVHAITPGDAAMRLLENTVCARLRPGEALAAATALARSCDAVAGTRGSAEVSLEALLT